MDEPLEVMVGFYSLTANRALRKKFLTALWEQLEEWLPKGLTKSIDLSWRDAQ